MKIDFPLMFEPAGMQTMAPQVEAAGFDGAYTFEGKHDPFVSLAAAAMATQKLELMTSIAVAFARNPMSLAYLGNDLQNLSGGRFILGLGTQVKAHIERRFSMPWSRPAARMREMVQAVRAIWDSWQNGEKLQFQGEFYRHTLMPPAFTPPENRHGMPPIFIAGVGPLMTEVAAEVGDGYFLHPFNTEKSTGTLSLASIERGLSRSGKSRKGFTVTAQVIAATGVNEQSQQDSLCAARRQIAFYASTPAYLPVLKCHGWEALHGEANRLSKQGRWEEMAGLIDDEIVHTVAVVGTPEEVARKIAHRFSGKVDRVAPLTGQPDLGLMGILRGQISAAIQSPSVL